MRIKYIVTTAVISLASVATVSLASKYMRWKREALERLQANSQIIETALGRVEYSITGSGPAVFIAHGSPGGYDQGMAVANMLVDERFMRIAPSRPGYLRTPLHQRTPETQADLYAALLDALGIDKVVMVGISGGGPSVLQFALRHPERCSGLIMLCAVSQRYSEHEQLATMSWLQRLIKPQIENIVYFNNFGLFLLEPLIKRQQPPLPTDVYQSLEMHHLRQEGFRNDMRQFELIGQYPLEQITAPTLVLHGDRDTNLAISHAELVAKKVPHARYVADEGGTHFFFIEHQEKIKRLVQEFLEASSQSEMSR